MDREESVQYFFDLIKKFCCGKFKVYIGMIVGVGKLYWMFQEVYDLIDNGVDVWIGYIEIYGCVGMEVLLKGLFVIWCRKLFYKGKEFEEMDLEVIICIYFEIVIVDELVYINVEGSLNEKCW